VPKRGHTPKRFTDQLLDRETPAQLLEYHTRMEFFVAIAVVALIAWGVKAASRRQARQQEDGLRKMAEQQAAEACAYIAEVSRAGAFPTIWMSNVNIKKGEFGLLHEVATLYEIRASRISMGVGTRVKIGKIPIYLGGGQSIPVENLHPTAEGDLYLSNERVIFFSSSRSSTLALKDIVGIDASLESITLHSAKLQKPKIFTVTNPAKWSLLIKLLSGKHLESPTLADGLTLTAQPTGTLGEVSFSARQIKIDYPAPA
jgi:hypothetical protein